MESIKRKIRLRNIIGYGTTDIFGNGSLAVVGTWMLYFYTTFCGLTPIQAGSILAIARVADSLISPAMGYITDNFGNTRLGKKFGRRRFFILLACPLMIIYVLLWIPNMNYWYYLFTYIVIEAFAAMVMIPYETLAAEMTNEFDVRTKMTSSRMLFAAIATFLSAWLPGRFFAILGKDSPTAFLANGVTLAIIFIIALLITYFSTWERPEIETDKTISTKNNDKNKEPKGNMLVDLLSVFRIKSFSLHLIIYLFSFTARDIVGAVYIFFVVYAMKTNQIEASNILTFGTLIGIPCNFIWPKIMAKIGPSNLLKVMYIIMGGTIAGYGLLYLSPFVGTSTAIVFLYIFQVTWGISNSGTGYVPWTVYTFIPDVDEIVTKRRREGLFAGIMTFARKTTSALAPFLTGIVLEESGFVKGAETQTPQALNSLVIYMVVATLGLLLISFLTTFFFKLSKENHLVLIKEIDRLRNDGLMADVDAETRKITERLTGFKYEKLWGNNSVGASLK